MVELDRLGHHDEAVRIARGLLRDRRASPQLTSAVHEFLAE